jgi:hypothetical protein
MHGARRIKQPLPSSVHVHLNTSLVTLWCYLNYWSYEAADEIWRDVYEQWTGGIWEEACVRILFVRIGSQLSHFTRTHALVNSTLYSPKWEPILYREKATERKKKLLICSECNQVMGHRWRRSWVRGCDHVLACHFTFEGRRCDDWWGK